jgi:hypothetical protein
MRHRGVDINAKTVNLSTLQPLNLSIQNFEAGKRIAICYSGCLTE